ncbi:MAG: adenylate/guanylate cyclase domain-containing protein [Chloroflexota bacterium]
MFNGFGQKVRVPLKVKLSVLITLLIVLSVLLVGDFLLERAENSLTAEITKRGYTIARDLAASAKNPLVTQDELTLSLLVRDAMRDEDVAYAIIADENGKIVAHGDLNFVGKRLERPKGLRPVGAEMLVQSYADAKGGHIIDFAVPMEFSKVPLGALYLGFSDRSIRQTIARARNQTLWITALMILGGIGGAIGLAIVLTKPIHKLAQGTKAIAAGSFDIVLPIAARDEIGDLTESFNEMAKSLREKEKIKHAFSSYVARQVVDEILKNPDEIMLSGARRDVSVIFCDMRGFTPLAERLPPEEVVAALNDFYSLMIDTTIKHDGMINKFLGDAVMAIFGAPVYYPDHCLRAVKTALAMQRGIAELSAKRVMQGKDPMAIGIGISAGEAVAGTVGPECQMEYTVIGDKVNLAARLESNAKPGQVLVSESTYQQVADKVEARCLGVMSVKGKEEEVTVYEIIGLVEQEAEQDGSQRQVA